MWQHYRIAMLRSCDDDHSFPRATVSDKLEQCTPCRMEGRMTLLLTTEGLQNLVMMLCWRPTRIVTRQDQATKLVEKLFLSKQDEHACDILTVPAFCKWCEYGTEQNCSIDKCQTHHECRNCSDHFEKHKECRRHFNPRLMLSLITEMSRQHGISGNMEYNRSEAAGKLFSELDFVSILAVRFHFRHFITLAFTL